ncbi:Elongation factor 1-gamma [Lucilia cuprina]|nr:Elongation factor 1-gamma [Lucilia cuprina]
MLQFFFDICCCHTHTVSKFAGCQLLSLAAKSTMATGVNYLHIPENSRAYKALIAAQYSGAKKFPSGKVPAFETSNGKYLSDRRHRFLLGQ